MSNLFSGPGARPGDEHPKRRPKGILTLTPEVQEAICSTIARGEFFDSASVLAGIPKGTSLHWLQRGRTAVRDNRAHLKSERVYVEFAEAVDKARAQADSRDLAMIALASKKDWKAAAWRLRARNPLRFGGGSAPVSVEVDEEEAPLPDGTTETKTTVSIGAPSAAPDELTEEDYAVAARVLVRRRRARLAAARGGSPDGQPQDPQDG